MTACRSLVVILLLRISRAVNTEKGGRENHLRLRNQYDFLEQRPAELVEEAADEFPSLVDLAEDLEAIYVKYRVATSSQRITDLRSELSEIEPKVEAYISSSPDDEASSTLGKVFAKLEEKLRSEEGMSASYAEESESLPSTKTLESMLMDVERNIPNANVENKDELMDQVHFIEDRLSLFPQGKRAEMEEKVSKLASSGETEQAEYAEEKSAAEESDSLPAIETVKSMLTDVDENIDLAKEGDANVELSDLVSYVEKIVPYFPEDEAAMNAQVSQVKNKLVAYGEPEQASYAEKGTSENNVLDSILDELESNLEEGTKEEREDLKDELYYVEQISSVNSNTKQVKRIDGMIEKIETGMNEGEESSNQDNIMDVNKILNVLSDRGIPQSKIEKVEFILNKKDGV